MFFVIDNNVSSHGRLNFKSLEFVICEFANLYKLNEFKNPRIFEIINMWERYR